MSVVIWEVFQGLEYFSTKFGFGRRKESPCIPCGHSHSFPGTGNSAHSVPLSILLNKQQPVLYVVLYRTGSISVWLLTNLELLKWGLLPEGKGSFFKETFITDKCCKMWRYHSFVFSADKALTPNEVLLTWYLSALKTFLPLSALPSREPSCSKKSAL